MRQADKPDGFIRTTGTNHGTKRQFIRLSNRVLIVEYRQGLFQFILKQPLLK